MEFPYHLMSRRSVRYPFIESYASKLVQNDSSLFPIKWLLLRNHFRINDFTECLVHPRLQLFMAFKALHYPVHYHQLRSVLGCECDFMWICF